MKPKTFSTLITDLTQMWMLWMKYNNIAKDPSFSVKERRQAAEKCEQLINEEYQITDQLDNFFK